MKNWKKDIGIFFTSQAISLFGSSLVQYAIIWYITLQTQSGVMMTISTLCGFVPQIIISLFAGVWADKYNKKLLIMISDGLIALSTLIIAVLFLFNIQSIWLLFAVLVIRSLGSGVQMPATTSFIPELVPEDKLMKVNGINTTIQSVMLIISPAVSGAMLANIPIAYIFFVDVITAIIGISVLTTLKYKFVKKSDEKVNYFSDIKEGISYTKNHKMISKMIIYLAAFNLLVTPIATLTPLLVTRTFGVEPWYLTLNEIVFFVGNIVGGVLISMWGGFKNKINTVGAGCIFCALFSVLIGIPFNFVFYLICIALIGLTMPFLNTPFTALLQENVEPDKLGRVFSLVTIISGAIMPISMVVYGPLADIISIESILIVTGVLFALGSIVMLNDKGLKKYGVSKKEDELMSEKT